jgi:hypothetical protein
LLFEATNDWRSDPHSRLTGGIVWAGALSNCKKTRGIKTTEKVTHLKQKQIYSEIFKNKDLGNTIQTNIPCSRGT